MTALLSIICDTGLQRVEILSYGANAWDLSWQSHLWKLSLKGIIDMYQDLKYQIELKYGLGFQKQYHGFVIERKS